MKKTWIMLLAAIALVLAACSDAETNEPKDVEEKDSHIEDKVMDEKADDVSEADEETEVEKQETSEEDDTSKKDTSKSTGADKSEDAAKEEEDDNLTNNDIVAFGFEIFEAQVNEDYEFLESILSKGSSVDKENNVLRFENVTYPHDYEFISKRDIKNLSERYIQGEDEIIVGYEVTDYENESSYIIDTQFIKEDGKWKLNDMDVNK